MLFASKDPGKQSRSAIYLFFFLLLGYKGIVRGKRDVAETQLRNGNLDETVAGSLSPLCNSTQTLAEQLHA